MIKVAVMLANGLKKLKHWRLWMFFAVQESYSDMIGFEKAVTGSHGIPVQADKVWTGKLDDYELVVLPGGMPGATNLRDDDRLMLALQRCKKKASG